VKLWYYLHELSHDSLLIPIPWINEFKSIHGDGMADQLMEEMYRPARTYHPWTCCALVYMPCDFLLLIILVRDQMLQIRFHPFECVKISMKRLCKFAYDTPVPGSQRQAHDEPRPCSWLVIILFGESKLAISHLPDSLHSLKSSIVCNSELH
jgi:hypothetical protein